MRGACLQEWKHTYHRAATSLQNREEKLSDAANLIENNLVLLGATAIEDKLQDGVSETIQALLDAEIRMWMLTGDKQETAINIGHACRLLNSNMQLIVINEDSLDVSNTSFFNVKMLGNCCIAFLTAPSCSGGSI